MSGRAWTPGPWSVRRTAKMYDGAYDYAINADGALVLAEAFGRSADGGYPPAVANARLIAAAPELFEALNSLAGSVGGLEIAEEAIRAAIGNTNWSVLQTHLAAARAALSKAGATS